MNAIGRLKLPHDEIERGRVSMAIDSIRRSPDWEIFVEKVIKPNMASELEVLESNTDDKLLYRAQGRRTAFGDIMKLFDAVDKAVRDGKRTI